MTEKKFQTPFGEFTEGERVRYDVYPHGYGILGEAHEDKIVTIDPDFLAYCREEGIATYCEWDIAQDVVKDDPSFAVKAECPQCHESRSFKLSKNQDATIDCSQCGTVFVPEFEQEGEFYIYDSETQKLYHTKMTQSASLLDLFEKFVRWDMEGDDETIAELLSYVKTNEDVEGYFQDRGSILFRASDITEF